jgi:hypothetical protein
MRFRALGVVAAITSIALFASAACADGKGKGKGGKGKGQRAPAEKVELKDLPPAVLKAAEKETPNATFTSAAKRSGKKNTVYTLQGTDGNRRVSLAISSSGEVLRETKAVERKGGKKAA